MKKSCAIAEYSVDYVSTDCIASSIITVFEYHPFFNIGFPVTLIACMRIPLVCSFGKVYQTTSFCELFGVGAPQDERHRNGKHQKEHPKQYKKRREVKLYNKQIIKHKTSSVNF